MNKLKAAIKLLYFGLFKTPKKLSNERLESTLRAKAHAIEKQGNIEETTDFISMIWCRQMFHEAKKRKILSMDEIEWINAVLFAKQGPTQIERSVILSNNEFFNTLKERRSIRAWTEGEISDAQFIQLIDAAKWAPSSSHRQPWHFILTRDKNKIEKLSELRGQKFVRNASNCILVLINTQAYLEEEASYSPFLDAGAAIQNLLLMAHSINLGACWVNFGKMEVSDQNMEEVISIFNIPKDFKIVSIIPIGNLPNSISRAPGRKKTEDLLHIEKFRKGT